MYCTHKVCLQGSKIFPVLHLFQNIWVITTYTNIQHTKQVNCLTLFSKTSGDDILCLWLFNYCKMFNQLPSEPALNMCTEYYILL